jgi:hypothetical protein
MGKITFYKDDQDPDHLAYQVAEDGESIGAIYRETYFHGNFYQRMTEWALDATMEARFGENFGSGHSRVQSLMKEIRDAIKAGK